MPQNHDDLFQIQVKPDFLYPRNVMRKITRSFLLLLVLATLTVQARADITINDVQQFPAAPAWSDNVNITSTGQAILANNVLIGQTKDITINIASGGVLSMSSTITDNHGVNNILIPANNQSLQFTGTGTFIKLGTGAIAMQNANVTGAGGYSAKFAFDDGGLIDVQEGTLRNGGYNSQNWASNKGDLRIASGASFDVWDGKDVTVDSLVGAGTIANGTAVAKVLTIGRFNLVGRNARILRFLPGKQSSLHRPEQNGSRNPNHDRNVDPRKRLDGLRRHAPVRQWRRNRKSELHLRGHDRFRRHADIQLGRHVQHFRQSHLFGYDELHQRDDRSFQPG